jgi:AcrR family transcriptional regulator
MKRRSPPARDGYHHGNLRSALVETALRLVAERGPEGFSLREAAREVGVSPGAAYRHFADKAALLTALAVDGHARLAAAMERAVARLPGPPGTKAHAVAAMIAIGEAYVEHAVRHPSHFRVMFGPCMIEEGFAPGCAPSGRDAFQILVDALDGLVAAGAVGAKERAGAEIGAWAGVHGLAALLVDGALELSARQRGDALLAVTRTFLLGLGCDPALLPPARAGVEADPRPPRRAAARGR